MPNASLLRAALSAVAVGLLLALLRRAGPRAGGLAAAVPVNSMPALFWLWFEHGGAYAATAARGSLWGTGFTALLALATVLAGQAARPRAPVRPRRRADAGASTLQGMLMAGAMSLAVAEIARRGGPRVGGMVAVVPVMATCALVAAYRQGGVRMMLPVLRGYLDGMLAKATFLVGLACGWTIGAGAWAWPLALLGAGVTLFAQRAWRRRHGRRSSAPARSPRLPSVRAPTPQAGCSRVRSTCSPSAATSRPKPIASAQAVG
jgi:hypothetical protein